MDWTSLGCCSLSFLLYYNTLYAGFVYDDRRAVVTNPDVTGQNPIESLIKNDFWGTPLNDPGSHGSYRPLCVASFRLNHVLTGLKPWSFHLFNILLHCLATFLVIVLSRRLYPKSAVKIGSVVAGLTFASHPIHTEAVAGIVGRADLLSCNFFLLCFLSYMEYVKLREKSSKLCKVKKTLYVIPEDSFRLSCHGLVEQIVSNLRRLLKSGSVAQPLSLLTLKPISMKSNKTVVNSVCCECNRGWKCVGAIILSVLFGVGATLCKEPGVTVLPLCALYDILKGAYGGKWNNKERLRSVIFQLLITATIIICRYQVNSVIPVFAAADNPTAKDTDIFTRLYTFAYLPIFNFSLLIWPNKLSFDWSMDAIPRIKNLLDVRNVASLIFYLILFKVTIRSVKVVFKNKEKIKTNYRMRYNNRRRYNNNYYSGGYEIKMLRHEQRRSYHAPYRERCFKRMCPCVGCENLLTEEHTSTCRVMNNNNTMTLQSCACSPQRRHKVQQEIGTWRGGGARGPHALLLMILALITVPFLPATNLFFYVGFVVAERVLYIPSVGYCLLIGLGAANLTHGSKSVKNWKMFLFSMIILVFCLKTFRRNYDWKDEESLFRSAVTVNPPRAYGNLGSVLSTQGRYAEAEVVYRKALLYRPNMADVHYNLGVLLHNEKRYDEAIKSFERAIHFRPSMALAYVNLGAALVADGRLAEAVSALRAGGRANGERVRDRREHDAARVSALVQLAGLHAQRSHWHKALATYREALEVIPKANVYMGWSRHNVLALVGEAHAQLSQWDEAERVTREILDQAPHDVTTNLFYAKILARNSSRAIEAEQWFHRAVRLSPDDPVIRIKYGEFLTGQKRYSDASTQLVRSAELTSPLNADYAALAARSLRDAGKCEQAEYWYRKVAQLRPTDSEAHSNLGAILHLNGKYHEAAVSYRRALKLQPRDGIVLTNLKRVRSLMSSTQHDIKR